MVSHLQISECPLKSDKYIDLSSHTESLPSYESRERGNMQEWFSVLQLFACSNVRNEGAVWTTSFAHSLMMASYDLKSTKASNPQLFDF